MNEKLNKKALILTLILLLAFVGFEAGRFYVARQVRVVYSLDKKQNDQEIIMLIDDAEKYVYFAIYTFTKDNIAGALIRAKERGLIVWGLVDRETAEEAYEKPLIDKLRAAGIIIETQKHFDGIMHLKTIVTDRAYATGSYNWTDSATVANDEVLEIGKDGYLRDQYLQIIKRILIANQ